MVPLSKLLLGSLLTASYVASLIAEVGPLPPPILPYSGGTLLFYLFFILATRPP